MTRKRGGYTLIELLIVLAVLAALAGLTLPAVRGPLDKSRLTGAGRQLCAALAKARALAIREGEAVQLRYQLNGSRYLIERRPVPVPAVTVLTDAGGSESTVSELGAEAAGEQEAEPAPDLPANPANSESAELQPLEGTPLREGLLPTGVTFAGPERLPEPATAEEQTGGPEESAGTGTAGPAAWSPPIVFQPNGRSVDHIIRLIGQRDFVVNVTLRGLTATATCSAPARATQSAPAATGLSAESASATAPDGQQP